MRRRLWYHFRQIFPGDHAESIREFAEWWSTRSGRRIIRREDHPQYLEDVHPRAFALLAKYGRDYTPRMWHKPPAAMPKESECFRNSVLLMRATNTRVPAPKSPVVYVEGIAWGIFAQPMLHAWNASRLSSIKAFDWTFHVGSPWTRYLGIPIMQEEYEDMVEIVHGNRDYLIRLFAKDTFPKIEKHLLKLMRSRNRRKKLLTQ